MLTPLWFLIQCKIEVTMTRCWTCADRWKFKQQCRRFLIDGNYNFRLTLSNAAFIIKPQSVAKALTTRGVKPFRSANHAQCHLVQHSAGISGKPCHLFKIWKNWKCWYWYRRAIQVPVERIIVWNSLHFAALDRVEVQYRQRVQDRQLIYSFGVNIIGRL